MAEGERSAASIAGPGARTRPEDAAESERTPSLLSARASDGKMGASRRGSDLGGCGYRLWGYYSVRESTDDAQIDGHINPISARVGGTVIAVNVDDNQYVKAGTVLVQIDPRDYQVALDRAHADLASSEAVARAARTNIPITTTMTASRVEHGDAGLRAALAGITVHRRK